MTAEELLTVADVARICRIHEVTVRRHIASGQLRSVKVGRNLRVRSQDLDAFLDADRPKTPRSLVDTELKPFTERDSLWNIVGKYDSGESWISSDKYRGLFDDSGDAKP